jgi:hypothetical protein
VTAARVAAVSPLEMVGRGEDEVGAFIVEVFGAKLLCRGFRLLFFG